MSFFLNENSYLKMGVFEYGLVNSVQEDHFEIIFAEGIFAIISLIQFLNQLVLEVHFLSLTFVDVLVIMNTVGFCFCGKGKQTLKTTTHTRTHTHTPKPIHYTNPSNSPSDTSLKKKIQSDKTKKRPTNKLTTKNTNSKCHYWYYC